MRLPITIISTCIALTCAAQAPVSLDSCRSMALDNNKQLMMSRQAITTAQYNKKAAFSAYLPALDFNGGYAYNQKKMSLLDKDQMLPTKTFNILTQKYEYDLVINPITGEPVKDPETGQYVPLAVAVIPKEAMEFDIHNVFFGAVTLTQPLYMGGKIQALNEITRFAEELATELHQSEAENVVYAVDGAYWTVVSLKAKEKLAESYVNLLDSLDHNVQLMVAQGVATRSDQLSVDVKLNSAKVDLVKVQNGLSLARMALAQVCGQPINNPMTLADENINMTDIAPEAVAPVDMENVYDRRHDLKALQLGIDIAGQQKRVAQAEMLPNVALMGAYSFTNPNMYDGFKKRFNGAFSVGVMVSVPIWHWGGNYYKYKAAESEELTMRLQLEDARDLVSLQVNQATFRADEARKAYELTRSNLEKANDNLRTATLGFREGVATADNVMEAQTAWLKANSEVIDAMIDVYMCRTYLSKALGVLVE